MELKQVKIYTDGGCLGNPGPGGYGTVLIFGNKRKELSGGFRLTTNNRMEIKAVIEGLKLLKYKCKVTVFSDSQYLVDAMMKGWAVRWRANNWKRTKKKPALNIDLWKELLELCDRHEVEFVWVRGHSGIWENERCDFLTKQAAQGENLSIDEIYEEELEIKKNMEKTLFDET